MTKRHLVRLTPSNSFNNDQVLNPNGETLIDVVLANPSGSHQAYLAPGQEIGEEVFIRHILRPRPNYEGLDDQNRGLWTLAAFSDSFLMPDVTNVPNPSAPFQWPDGQGQSLITFLNLTEVYEQVTPNVNYQKGPTPAVLILRWTGVYWAIVFASSTIQRP